MDVKFFFERKEGILYKEYFGEITLEYIFKTWMDAYKDQLISNSMKGIIIDIRHANFVFSPKDSKKISDFFKTTLNIDSKLKIALLADSPQTITYAELFKRFAKDFMIQTFTTKEWAMKWMLG